MNHQAKRGIAIGVVLIGAWLLAQTTIEATVYAPEEEAPPPPSYVPPPQLSTAKPSRLLIPSVGVDAHVQDVGIGKTGNMAVPSNYSDVGWYRYGTLPGAVGSAVIDGHVDNGFGFDAVFADLAKLKPGDELFVEQEDGSRLRFVVEEVKTYLREEVPLEMLFNRSDKARLNLITCTGIWDVEEESYDSRTIAYSVLAQ